MCFISDVLLILVNALSLLLFIVVRWGNSSISQQDDGMDHLQSSAREAKTRDRVHRAIARSTSQSLVISGQPHTYILVWNSKY